MKSYIKDSNHFLNKLRSLPKLPDNIILCTVDVAGLYQNISHEEDLFAFRKRLDNRIEKYMQKRETAIGTKFGPPYSILFMAELEE